MAETNKSGQKICTLWIQFFDAFFASKRYPFKNIFIVIHRLRAWGKIGLANQATLVK